MTSGADPTAWRTTSEAEHGALLHSREAQGSATRMATYFAASGAVLVSVEDGAGGVVVLGGATAEEQVGATAEAEQVREHCRTRTGGRLFVFDGSEQLTGTVTVADLLLSNDIDVVSMVGDREPLPGHAVVDTQDFVRPRWSQGRSELVVRPAAGGLVVPFEQPNPTPCCAAH